MVDIGHNIIFIFKLFIASATQQVVEENGKLIIYQQVNKYMEISNLATLRNTLFYNIEKISDIMNALNYGFLNRLVGIVASDPVLGMEVASRQYGGLQLIHNAAESLMKDYVESYGDNEYNGIVVFGYKNRASTLDELIVHFPSFAEHDLEYLVVLAHESFHLTTYNLISDDVPPTSTIPHAVGRI